jgi:hypothetical protein
MRIVIKKCPAIKCAIRQGCYKKVCAIIRSALKQDGPGVFDNWIAADVVLNFFMGL